MFDFTIAMVTVGPSLERNPKHPSLDQGDSVKISHPGAIKKLRELFGAPMPEIEARFSPYFYRYFKRLQTPSRFDGYIYLCQSLFRITRANNAFVLDLGCGFGVMATFFRVFGAKEVIGYDLNTEKVELFKRLLTYLRPEINNVEPIFGDSSKIPFPEASFDVVIANESVSHFGDLDASLQEAYRVLKIGGALLIRDGNNSLFLPGRIRRRQFWRRVEEGPVNPDWFRGTDLPLPYKEVRKRMIQEKYPSLRSEEILKLAEKTGGMFGDEIFNAVDEFRKSGTFPKRSFFRYRNPITGEFPEKEINPLKLKKALKAKGFCVSFVPYFHSKSFRDLEMSVKSVSHVLESHLYMGHLFLIPGFALLGIKTK